MRPIKQRLRGSTLVEMLVMMLVAGIIFLSVMDGMRLFSRLLADRTEALMAAGRQTGAYYRIVGLITDADSIGEEHSGRLDLYREGRRSELTLCDSALVFSSGDFRDTLLQGIGGVRLERNDRAFDTVVIRFGAGFAARYAVSSPARAYRTALDEIEKEYGYEE